MKRKPSGKWYWVALVAAVTLAALYVDRRELPKRYELNLESEEAIRDARDRGVALEASVEAARHRLQSLESNPLEREAIIRRTQRKLRPGEIVYRVEPLPEAAAVHEAVAVQADGDAKAAPKGDQRGTSEAS